MTDDVIARQDNTLVK